jgi:anti-repressor protein
MKEAKEMKVFSNPEFGKLGVITIDGKSYFPATKCALKLGYNNTKDAIIRHCRGVVKHDLIDKLGRTQELNFIPEGDLYRLIIRSKLPAAERFERWVFDEVLPQIRQTGGYIPVAQEDSDMVILSKAVLIGQKTMAYQKERIEKLEKSIIADRPKVNFADAVTASEGSILIRDMAKLLNQNGYDTGELRLFRRLRNDGYLIRQRSADYNHPTRKSRNLDLIELNESVIQHQNGTTRICLTPRVTTKGQLHFLKIYGKPTAVTAAQ